jgi:autotransporter-associated beta strand protein
MTFQLQFVEPNKAIPTWIKGVLVELNQSGANVSARAIRTYLYNFSEGETRVTGLDLDKVGQASNPGKYNVQQYGVKSLVLRTVTVPSLTLTANNQSCMDMVADNGQIVFSGLRAQPLKIIARNHSSVIYDEYSTTSNPYNDGGSFMRVFESGSTLLASGNLKIEGRAAFDFTSSTNTITIKNYFNELTLRDGSRITGSANLYTGYYNTFPTSTCSSVGLSANRIDASIAQLRHNQVGNMTNTLVLVTDTDLFITGDIKDEGNVNLQGSCIVKRGDAKLILSGDNTFAGRFTVEEGMVELGSGKALPSSAPLTLAGGTIKCGTFANATGPLTLSGDSSINLDEGSIAFADSSTIEWADDATLSIMGTGNLPINALRFGTSERGLTSAQIRQITYNGEKVLLDDSGYLRLSRGFMLILK